MAVLVMWMHCPRRTWLLHLGPCDSSGALLLHGALCVHAGCACGTGSLVSGAMTGRPSAACAPAARCSPVLDLHAAYGRQAKVAVHLCLAYHPTLTGADTCAPPLLPQPANDLALLRKRHKDEEDARRKAQMDQRIKDLRCARAVARQIRTRTPARLHCVGT